MEVCVQMAIIFVGKQFLLSIVEYQLPRLWKLFNTLKVLAGQGPKVDKHLHPQWIQDFKLVEWGKQGLFYEYLEMVIQYGFVTIFATAFPLAPLFALINNIFELRLDAKKLLVYHRRPVAYRVRDIGVWLQILESLGRIAVLTNGLIIAFTSSFIPKMVYTYAHSQDHSLKGYINFTLSTFDPADFEHDRGLLTSDIPETCAYYDFRHPPDAPDERKYKITEIYWHVLAARLAFVFVFQNVVMLSVMLVKWIVPNISSNLKDEMRREAYLTNEIVIRTELLKATGKIDADGKIVDSDVDNSDFDVKISVETHFEDDQDKSNNRDQKTNRLKTQLTLPTDGTGDITDGHIVL